MKKVVVLALLLFVCVGSLLAQENDKQKKKSITDSLFRIDQVDVMQKKKRIDLLGLDVGDINGAIQAGYAFEGGEDFQKM